jgi:segregation and condensation protein A
VNLKEVQGSRKKAAERLAEYHIKTKTFSGPFDVLLNLIFIRKVDVCEVDLSSLTKDYLDFLRQNADPGIKLAPEFIRVAALLVYIKTRAILEDAVYPEELEGLPQTEGELIESLKALKEASRLAEVLHKRFSERAFSFPCSAFYQNGSNKKSNNFDISISMDELLKTYIEAFKRQPVSIKDKFVGTESFKLDYFISLLTNLLEQAEKCSILEAVRSIGCSRRNLVSVFMAALKMQQEGLALLVQEVEFSDIEILRI